MARSLGLAAVLAIFWFALSGYWQVLILALGAVSVWLCVYIAHRMEVSDREGYPIHLTLGALSYYPWLFKEIIVSNLSVAKAILKGPGYVRPQVLKIEASQSTDLGRATYANSITLTPGTITIAATEREFVVHALMDETADGVKEGEMDRRVCRMVGEDADARGASS